MYQHRKIAKRLKLPTAQDVAVKVVALPKAGLSLASLPGKTLESATIKDLSPEETPFRGEEDLKTQYFGPTLLNKQRLWELGDSLAYQSAYGIPAAAIGASAGPAGMLGGLALGKILGQVHLLKKEKDRLATAKKDFSADEQKALNEISTKSRNWALTSALLAGLGAGGVGHLAGHDQFGKTLTPVLEGAAAASLAGLLGGLAGHYFARKNLLNNKRFSRIINRYS